jgi:hypothetical protein
MKRIRAVLSGLPDHAPGQRNRTSEQHRARAMLAMSFGRRVGTFGTQTTASLQYKRGIQMDDRARLDEQL